MDGPPPPEEDFSQLSVADRLAHKNWKARVSGYETLIKTFQNTASDSDPAFNPYINNPDTLKKIVTDANAVAQEKGVESVVAFVKFAGESAARTREVVVPALVDKCFGSSRAGTRNQAIELVLQYVEVENGGAGVVSNILPGLAAKQPKVVSGSVMAMKDILKAFGAQAVPPPPVLKALPKIFGHTDKTVRAEGTALAQTLYLCIGPAIEPWLADLKPVQVKELKESFEAMDSEGKGKGTFKAERYTRAQAREIDSGTGVEEDGAQDDPADMDPRAFAEEVDVVPKLPSGLQAALTSTKWKERKEALDDVLAVFNATPRIKDASELGDVARALAGRMVDANINCVIAAANCIEALAKGMMSNFARFREIVTPPMLERLKERKQSVTDAIGNALDAVFSTTTLPDVLENILTVLGSKNPQVKEGTLKFLGRCLSASTIPPVAPQVKPLSEALAALLEDSFEGARSDAAICLGTLMKIVGERPLNAIMDQLAEVRKVKVKEAFEKATVKCKAGGAPPPRAAPANAPSKQAPPKASPSEDALIEDVSPPKPRAKPPARFAAKKSSPDDAADFESPPTAEAPKSVAARLAQAKRLAPSAAAVAAVAAASSSKSAKSAAPSASSSLDSFKYKHTPEDAEALAADLIPSQIASDLGDGNWKIRLAALEEMTNWKGLNEKNFQVSSKLYSILTILADQSPSFGRSCAAIATPHLSEKLAYETLGKQKAPKVLADSLVWFEGALTEFGVAGVSLRSLIGFLGTALSNSNAAVRTNATKTLVTIKLFVGPGIKDLLGDINPQLLATIQSEFDKVEGNPAPEPTRSSVDVQSLGSSGAPGKGAAGTDALDDLFPRVELEGLLKGTTIFADAKSESWKTKKEALETLQAILDQGPNKRLKPIMGDIGQIIKARVTDANKTVQVLALDIVSRIATGMGKPFEKHTRFYALPIATVLSDQKSTIRLAGLATLTAIAEACEGVESLVHGFATALESANPLQRSTLLSWIASWFKEHEPNSSLDLSAWAAPIISCLDDRNGDVRKGAQAVLPFVVAQAGVDYVLQQANSLKSASRSTVIPLVKAAAAPGKPAKPTPAPAPIKTSAPKSISPPPQSPPPTSALNASVAGPASKLTGVRRKLPQGSIPRPESRASVAEDAPPPSSRLPAKSGLGSLKLPTSSFASKPSASAAPSPIPSASSPFVTMNIDLKRTRLVKDGTRWIVESGPTRKDLIDSLQSQVEPHASKELTALLFSRDHNAVNDHVSGLGLLCDFYSALAANDDKYGFAGQDRNNVGLANIDLTLKYVSIRVHEPQPNLIAKCLDVVDNVMAFLRDVNYQLLDSEALCFVPTIINKLGDAREAVRVRVQQIIQTLPKVYAYSRVFQLLMDHGLKSKVAKTRQGSLDEMAVILKRTGVNACEPTKSFPVMASMISDKDAAVRKSALSALSEGYVLIGESLWSYVGALSPKDKTQLEERLRRVAGPSNTETPEVPPTPATVAASGHVSRFSSGVPRPGSRIGGIGGLPRPSSPAVAQPSRLARPSSPVRAPAPSLPKSSIAAPTSPRLARPKSFLPSRLGPARGGASAFATPSQARTDEIALEKPALHPLNGDLYSKFPAIPDDVVPTPTEPEGDVISLTISKILSSDAARSVDALKQIQKILEVGPEDGLLSPQYRELSDHTEGLIETITLQMNHVFENSTTIDEPENFRLAKHLIQTINAFCDHSLLAESVPVDILTGLFEELTIRLLQTDESESSKVKDLSRFINMIILRLFATCRRMTVLRSLFTLLLQIVKPFPASGTLSDSKEAKVAELVLKCIWKLARNIPTDLEKQELDPVELFPAIEHFLQSIPPNEWRARATNKVPSGDMPLRTIKVIIQHVVAFYGDEVYDFLSSSFDDPSATIVYPYVYRILNTSRGNVEGGQQRQVTNGSSNSNERSEPSPASRPTSPPARSPTISVERGTSSPSRRTSQSASANGGGMLPPPVDEPDPDEQLLTIINHISSETTGAMHKEGITELHHFLKAYPHKKPRVDKMLENTGPAFRKYIARALASRAAEDEERTVAVADTLSRLESNSRDAQYGSFAVRSSASPKSPRRTSGTSEMAPAEQDKLSRLHDLFQYRSSTTSNGSSHARSKDSDVCRAAFVAPVHFVECMSVELCGAAVVDEPVGPSIDLGLSHSFHTMSVSMPARSPDFVYDAVILFWRTVTSIFFREIRPRGAYHIPKDGPVIFVGAPHHNQFLDPLLLTSEVHRETHRRVEFLIAAKSMKRKTIGFFASLMSSIPVSRAADNAQRSIGLISLSDDDSCLVIGHGTKFTAELKPKWQIMLPKSLNFLIAEVTEIISDTELRIKKEFGGESGKGTARRLKDGGCIGIFPEGGSHDRTDLLPLKAGVAVMALGAMANDPSVKVKIIPVGLSYFHAHRFRSRAVVEFGSAMEVPSELINMFKEGGSRKREACSKLLDLVYDGLKTVTLRAPDYETLMVTQAARRLYETPGQHLTLGQVVELNKRFLEAYQHFKDEPRIQKLKESVIKYNRAVRDLGLRDHQVPRAKPASWKTLGLLTYRLGLLIVWSIFALPGVILNGPIFILASILSRQKAKEALAASTVKVAGRDVLATWKILISLGVVPILYATYAVSATLIAIKANAPSRWRLLAPLLTFLILPIMSYAALKFGEAGFDILKSLRPLVIALFPGQQRSLDRLKKMRIGLSNELTEVINEFGPKLWDDFDHWRILVPSASVPPSSGTPGLWRRKSGTGAVDAQGNLLVHPMASIRLDISFPFLLAPTHYSTHQTWLDERLFGWSRSAARGTSAWSGNASQEPSRVGSPDMSDDDEDDGDYEHVLGYLPSDGDGTPSRLRSRSVRSSYADLQQLKTTPVVASGASARYDVGLGGDLFRDSQHRERKGTLNDGVPVERIAVVDRDETFREATDEINEENDRIKHRG
ncbi:hypothetical protein EW145_g3859 [Phellinidium pouzarii]|uniref:VHS domain-containing protein n=1 Tax=Phellinidium pouzarii TaxID=167371 RepID=A0A4S4L5M7_9AGAM|nr:hypothetical protein EW145_g3859 [Phellinidium pouzarii]